MPKNSYETVQSNYRRLLAMLKQNPDGLRSSELAQMLGIERRTVDNYLTELERSSCVYKVGRNWNWLSDESRLPDPLNLLPEEAMTLYLGMRQLVKQSDRRNGVAETLLLQLSEVLDQHLHLGDGLGAAARLLTQRPYVQGYEDIYRTMMQSYLYGRVVKIVYHPYKGRPFTTEFHPYLFEPSAIGFATYALGYSHIVGAWRTYKLERIESAQLTRQTYRVDESFDGVDVLRNAWSIYYGEETINVVLRFAPEVVKRVLETQWHPSQRDWVDNEKPYHHCLSFDIADTTDLKPWIRTWGSTCEVIEPLELRQEIKGQIRQLMAVYDIDGCTEDDHSMFGEIFG